MSSFQSKNVSLPRMAGTRGKASMLETIIVREHRDFRGNLMKELSHLSGIVRDMLEVKKSFVGSLGMEAGCHGGHLCIHYNEF